MHLKHLKTDLARGRQPHPRRMNVAGRYLRIGTATTGWTCNRECPLSPAPQGRSVSTGDSSCEPERGGWKTPAAMSDRIRHDNTGPAQRPHAQEVVPGRSRAAGVQYLAPERAVNANLTRSAAAKHCRASAEA